MPQLTRSPVSPRLRLFVQTMWASAPDAGVATPRSMREHVLPTGATHLVFRLSGPPLRIFDGMEDRLGHAIGQALVGGARASHYLRDVSTPSASVGALLRPGAALLLLGAPEHELAGRHTLLDDLWRAQAAFAHERLLAAASLSDQLDVFEQLLLDRLGESTHSLDPAVAQAMLPLRHGTLPVRALAERAGCSHRHFIDLFRRATGLAPKTYARVQRLDRVLALAVDPRQTWSQIALAAGYSDQAHLSREFGALTGLSPQAWRIAAPSAPRHVPR
ncbi:helix-turn-helix transcriptional regulator [Variovorax dokdonensis]|uniref:Helix-turn-helix transcriptional regulator n=1 Tax=Variovorax dokdonensis TaxID=344883 RepID=A0ABT7N863_9BURK|nr:helix-turn-helix transcriptional regulator [Variovorax dokdonensis]MDM0044117.1 helix-turn-helix transcriptional regulator [Variovorax dokdonensis]